MGVSGFSFLCKLPCHLKLNVHKKLIKYNVLCYTYILFISIQYLLSFIYYKSLFFHILNLYYFISFIKGLNSPLYQSLNSVPYFRQTCPLHPQNKPLKPVFNLKTILGPDRKGASFLYIFHII